MTAVSSPCQHQAERRQQRWNELKRIAAAPYHPDAPKARALLARTRTRSEARLARASQSWTAAARETLWSELVDTKRVMVAEHRAAQRVKAMRAERQLETEREIQVN